MFRLNSVRSSTLDLSQSALRTSEDASASNRCQGGVRWIARPMVNFLCSFTYIPPSCPFTAPQFLPRLVQWVSGLIHVVRLHLTRSDGEVERESFVLARVLVGKYLHDLIYRCTECVAIVVGASPGVSPPKFTATGELVSDGPIEMISSPRNVGSSYLPRTRPSLSSVTTSSHPFSLQ